MSIPEAVTSVAAAATIIESLARLLVKAWGQNFDEVMQELAKRQSIDGRPSDEAAGRMDEHLPESMK